VANIVFPAVSLSRLTLNLAWPGQRVHESIYTGEQQVIDRGVGIWEGSFEFPGKMRVQEDNDIRAIEVFLSRMSGASNTFDIPIHSAKPSQSELFADGTDVRVTAQTRSGNDMVLTVNQVSGFLAGHYFTLNNSLFRVESTLAANSMLVAPYRPIEFPDDGTGVAVVWNQPTLRARRTSATAIPNNIDPEYAGPWTIEFRGLTQNG